MDITPLVSPDKNILKGYGNGGFTINDETHNGSISLSPTHVEPWNAKTAADINIESLSQINLNDDVEILLIGCGETHIPMPHDIVAHFANLNIGVEIMTTGAACRTYNVLLSEERVVIAALIAV